MPEQEKDKVILVGVETEENFAIFDTSMDELRDIEAPIPVKRGNKYSN